MRKIDHLLLFGAASISLMASQQPAYAGGAAPVGTINTIQPLVSPPLGVLFFNTTGSHTGGPSCATGTRWAIDTTTSAGQTMASVVLTAYALGKQIAVTGTGTCSAWSDTETVYYLTVAN